MARSPRIEVTGFAASSPFTIDLVTELKRRLPGVNFVWLMGADTLAQFHLHAVALEVAQRDHRPVRCLDEDVVARQHHPSRGHPSALGQGVAD